MNRTPIEWVRNPDGSQGFSWNPWGMYCAGPGGVRCPYCYVDRHRHRSHCADCRENKRHLHGERLDQPLKRKKPSTIFVCSCADPFDATIRMAWRLRVLWVIGKCAQHRFILLTKSPEIAGQYKCPPNVWLGVSVENQEAADLRIPQLLKCNAALRFVSYEPAHGPVELDEWMTSLAGARAFMHYERTTHDCGGCGDEAECRVCKTTWRTGGPRIDWLIIGAETGNRKGRIIPKREWIQSAIDQARAAGVPVFVKRKVVELFPEFAGIEEFPENGSRKDAKGAKEKG